MERLHVSVETGTEACAADLIARQPSVVLLATGSRPWSTGVRPETSRCLGPYDVPSKGGHVLVRDEMGRLAAMLTAERLAAEVG